MESALGWRGTRGRAMLRWRGRYCKAPSSAVHTEGAALAVEGPMVVKSAAVTAAAAKEVVMVAATVEEETEEAREVAREAARGVVVMAVA